jgi:hypothetical protein
MINEKTKDESQGQLKNSGGQRGWEELCRVQVQKEDERQYVIKTMSKTRERCVNEDDKYIRNNASGGMYVCIM